MKTYLLIGLCLLSTLALAQEAPPAPTAAKIFSADERAEAKAQLQSLAQAFGVETPASSPQAAPATTPTAAEPPKKDIAQVADKALDMVTQLVGSISATLEKVSPKIWEIFVKQQYAAAISELIVPWGMVLVAWFFSSVVRKNWKYDPNENIFSNDNPFTNRGWRGFVSMFIPYLVGFIFVIYGCNAVADAVPRLINPEYYAVRDLLQMLLAPGNIAKM